MTKPAKPHQVVALIYDKLCSFEFGIVADIFGQSRPEFDVPLYELCSVALEDGPLRALGGLHVTPTSSPSKLKTADTVLIPGWRDLNDPVPEVYIKAVRAAHARGARIMTICSGVYVLAAAGLLSGRTVTTHWLYAGHFAEKYPDIIVKCNELYIEEGNIITAAGSAAGIDACLHVVRSDHGAKVANSVARRLVMHAHRQGDQAQYIEQPIRMSEQTHRLSNVMEHVREDLAGNHSIDRLAAMAGMSVRTFQRRFADQTGLPAMKWVTQERVREAQVLLETTQLSVNEISEQLGFGNAEALQYHFRQTLSISPASFRKRFLQNVA